jgi:hypothetical protein
MHWMRGVLRLCTVALLYWWGVRLLLKVASLRVSDRALEARWPREQTARQKRESGKWRTAGTAGLVYLAR